VCVWEDEEELPNWQATWGWGEEDDYGEEPFNFFPDFCDA
jgi:hypothetical protein